MERRGALPYMAALNQEADIAAISPHVAEVPFSAHVQRIQIHNHLDVRLEPD